MDEMGKRCSKCDMVKPLREYYQYKNGRPWGSCKACVNAHKRAYRKANREIIREWDRLFREANREKLAAKAITHYHANREQRLEQQRAYKKANREKVRRWARAYQQAYRKANPLKVKAARQRQEARRRNAPGRFTAKDIIRQWHRQNGECFWCGTRCGTSPQDTNTYHVDHITPLARGGSNWPRNLCISCPSCNMSKQDKYPVEFRFQAKCLPT